MTGFLKEEINKFSEIVLLPDQSPIVITSSKVTRHAFKIPVILLIANLFKYVKYTEAADKKHVINAFTGEVVGETLTE